MEAGLWVLYAAVSFVIILDLIALLGDWKARRQERHAH